QPQDQPIEDRHALGPPPFRGARNQLIDLGEPGDRIARQPRRERPQLVGRRIDVGPLQREERLGRVLDVAAPDFPLIEDLQRGLTGAVARILPRSRHRATSSARAGASAARSPPPSRSPPPPPRIPCCPGRRRRAPAPPPRSWSSARRTPSARRSRRPPRSARARPPTRCTRN